MKYYILLISLFFSFCAKAQDDCANVVIEDVFIHPTQPDILMIRTHVAGDPVFNYPGFKVYSEGEEIGDGETVFFMLAGTQFHAIDLTTAIIEEEAYDLEIELWTTFFGSQVCTYEWQGTPYTTEECFDGNVWLQLNGTEAETVDISIEHDNGTEVFNLEYTFNVNNQSWSDPLCLGRGCYTIVATPSDGSFSTGVFISYQTEGHVWFNELMQEGADSYVSTLEIWEGCTIVGVDERTEVAPKVVPNPLRRDQSFRIIGSAGLSSVEIRNLSGAIEAQLSPSQLKDFRFNKPGMYFITSRFSNGSVHTSRLVVE